MTDNFASGGPVPPVHEDGDLLVLQSKSFEAFDAWIDEQLALLVARWAPLAAPNASRVPSPRQRGVPDKEPT